MIEVSVSVKGIPELQAFLRAVPLGVKTAATRAVAEYIIGDMRHGLKHYPEYIYVNRYAGFPELGYVTSTGIYVPGFKSAKQHHYVMAAISEGKIVPGVPRRTSEAQRGWHTEGEPPRYKIVSRVPYIRYLMGDQEQTRMHKLIGWRKTSEVIRDNLAGAKRSAQAAVNKWIRENRK